MQVFRGMSIWAGMTLIAGGWVPLAFAQNAETPQVLPSTGLWWSPGENGQFMQLAIGSGGYVLATLTESDAQGQPTYRILQGVYQANDPRAGAGLGKLQSPFYRVVDSTCLECGPGNGRTVDTGQTGTLRFIDGTHAELFDRNQVVRRYERFPLFTSAAQITAARVSGQGFWLSAGGTGGVVQLEPVSRVQSCAPPDGGSVTDFRLRFVSADPAWAARFEPLLIQIGVGHNPRIQARIEVPLFDRYCVQPSSFFSCARYEVRPSNTRRCELAYELYESDGALRGVAETHAGAGLLYEFNGTYTPYTPATYAGAFTLQALPND